MDSLKNFKKLHIRTKIVDLDQENKFLFLSEIVSWARKKVIFDFLKTSPKLALNFEFFSNILYISIIFSKFFNIFEFFFHFKETIIISCIFMIFSYVFYCFSIHFGYQNELLYRNYLYLQYYKNCRCHHHCMWNKHQMLKVGARY